MVGRPELQRIIDMLEGQVEKAKWPSSEAIVEATAPKTVHH